MDGAEYRRHSHGTALYHSLCGPIKIGRFIYRKSGVRNGPTIVPLEISSQLIERATPALAYRAALGDAQCPGRQWEQQLRASHRRPPSRSTLERIAKKIGTVAKEKSPGILAAVRNEEPLPSDAKALSIGLDRTTIPMEEKLRYADNVTPLRTRKKPYTRAVPAPVEVNYRMGYVGTVSVIGSNGDCLQTYRYGCSADTSPTDVLNEMTKDLLHLQRQHSGRKRRDLPMAIVQDGAPEMWTLVETAVAKAFPNTHFYKAIDRYHLAERLAESLKALKDPFLNRDLRMRDWADDLENRNSAIDKIERFILEQKERLNKLDSLSAARAEILRTHLKYIKNNKHLMRYATLKKMGLPTGSGATEGACKSLIMIRAKGCGQRWHSKGVNSVITLRAMYQNGRLDSFWNNFLKQQKCNIQQAA